MGAKKFGMSLGNQGNQTFSGGIPGFCRDIPGVPEKFEEKKFVFDSRPIFSGADDHCLFPLFCSSFVWVLIARWGGGLPREGVGAKKFGMSLEAQGEN